ncbi:MAG: PEP-CTERM sorting domain-containing protein [Verrucomicrobiota bacterium JB024]|nr:PEP-CTERM sorting domain-containing protein [Verrucomicrobiota bacterium JB024]
MKKCIGLLLISLLTTSVSQAEMLTYKATGTVTTNRDFIKSGDAVSMTFTYDDSATGTITGGGTQGSYVGTAQGVYAMDVVINTSEGLWESTATTGNIVVYNPGTTGGDSFQVTSTLPPATWTSTVNGYTPDAFKLELVNETGNTYDSLDLPSSLSMSDFTKLTGTVYFNGGGFFDSVSFNVTDLQLVPEPATYAALFGIAALAMGIYVKRRRRS